MNERKQRKKTGKGEIKNKKEEKQKEKKKKIKFPFVGGPFSDYQNLLRSKDYTKDYMENCKSSALNKYYHFFFLYCLWLFHIIQNKPQRGTTL